MVYTPCIVNLYREFFVKRILVTDTHLGYKKANDFYLELVHTLFEDISTYAEENNIKEIIHLGDFFDNRKNMSLKTLFYARAIGRTLQRFDKAYLILGNHDLFYKDRYLPNSHQIFGSMSHLEIIDEPTEVGNMLLVPWVVEGKEWVDFGDFISDTDMKYCLGHWEINGAAMNQSGQVVKDGDWNFNIFSKFERTFSGHFHTIGTYDHNVTYLGAPYHMTFNDNGPRGFYVFDDDTGELEFIQWDKSPKFVQWNAKPDQLLGNEFEGQVVKIIFNEDYGTTTNNQIISEVQQSKPLQTFTEYKFSKGMTESTVTDDVQLMGPLEIHKDFVFHSEVPQHLNVKVLDKILDQLYEEVGV